MSLRQLVILYSVLLQTALAHQSVNLMWDYPDSELSTNLTFKLYGTNNASLPKSSWPLLTNLPGTNRTCTVRIEPGQNYFVLTASNYLGESDFSDMVSTLGCQPTVTLAFPTNNAYLDTNRITLRGAARDIQSVAQVLVKLNGGAFTPAFLTTNPTAASVGWSLPLNLVAGNNTVTVKSVDSAGIESLATNRSFAAPATLKTVVKGSATLTPPLGATNLYVGRNYTITATPAPNNLFSNWVSVANGIIKVYSTAKLTFTMQPNLTLTANFTTNSFPGNYYGLFSETSRVTPQSAGLFKLTANSRQGFSGSLYLDGQTYGFAGRFDVAGRGTSKEILRAGKPRLLVALQLRLDGSDEISGTVSSEGWAAPLVGDKMSSTPLLGSYTLVIAGQTNTVQSPAGDGYGLVKVKPSGRAVCSGHMGDGQNLMTVAAGISQRGDWPVYGRLYKDVATREYKGIIIGWLQFTNSGGRDLRDGRLIWIKTPTAVDTLYPTGFTNEPVVRASAYNAPVLGARALGVTNVVVVLQGGNLGVASPQPALLEADNRFSVLPPNEYALKSLQILGNSGGFKGQFLHPGRTNTPTVMQGALLQDEQVVRGYFPGTNQTGAFQLHGN